MLPPYSTLTMEAAYYSETTLFAIRLQGVTTRKTKIWKITVVKNVYNLHAFGSHEIKENRCLE
jgi:hypothetical protein